MANKKNEFLFLGLVVQTEYQTAGCFVGGVAKAEEMRKRKGDHLELKRE